MFLINLSKAEIENNLFFLLASVFYVAFASCKKETAVAYFALLSFKRIIFRHAINNKNILQRLAVLL